MKFTTLKIILLTFLPILSLDASSELVIGKGLDSDVLIQLAKLCDVAYSPDSTHLQKLEEEGWEILQTNKFGIQIESGPYCGYVFRGSTTASDFIRDFKAARRLSLRDFPKLPKSYLHNGITEYYAEFSDQLELHKPYDSDQHIILAGHSLGGACALLGALDILNTAQTNPDFYSESFCSIFTLGSPAVMGPELVTTLDSNIKHGVHAYAFQNDLVATVTRGKRRRPLILRSSLSPKAVFQQSKSLTILRSDGVLTHGLDYYIGALSTGFLNDETSGVEKWFVDQLNNPR